MDSKVWKRRDTSVPPPILPTSQFQQDLIALIPRLNAFSRILCRGRPIAEDLAQEALTKAWRAHDGFEPGTNLKAWLFMILRNEYNSHLRRAWREICWDEVLAERIAAPPREQEWAMELSDTVRALGGLHRGQQQALTLVGAAGLSYADAANLCAAPEGTIKSRVARGRAALRNALDGVQPIPPRAPLRTANGTEHHRTHSDSTNRSSLSAIHSRCYGAIETPATN